MIRLSRRAAATLLSAALLAGCHESSARASLTASEPPLPGVRVAKPQARLERLETSITGEVRARRSATLAARVGGTVQRLRAEVGDRVKEGQPLVELDPETARLNVDSARAAQAAARSDLSLAAVELKRNRMLLEADASSQA